MNRNVILVLVWVCTLCHPLFGQPVLTREAIAPRPEDFFIGHFCSVAGVSRGDAGPDVRWDFSRLKEGSSDSLLFSACADAYCDSFPGSDMSYSFFSPADQIFLSSSAESVAIHGASSGVFEAFFADPQDLMFFPMTYQSTHQDSVVQYLPGVFSFESYDEWYADAYGTLLLPGATYRNALRIHKRRLSRYVGSGDPQVRSDEYIWFAAGFHYPLLEMVYDTAAGKELLSSVAYYHSPKVAGLGDGVVSRRVSIYPNPARSTLQIQGIASGDARYIICNSIGRQIMTGGVKAGTTSLDISSLASGVYHIRLFTENNAEVTRFVKQ